MDPARWRPLLHELARRHAVPGASLAVLADGEVTAVATGVLHRGTGVEATADSLFQIGSITKVWTATLLMRLVERGVVAIDTPVVEVLPAFRVADPEVSRAVTMRHLLCHTSGIAGDFVRDTGRGDDCLALYVRACADVPQMHPLGATFSYCNAGYIVLGRVIEILTGMTWDAALGRDLIAPLGLTHTWTLPEDVLRFRAAMGHVTAAVGEEPRPAAAWMLPRSDGPAGLICATAADVVAFARLHLDGGRAPDGERVLAASSVAEMQRPQVDLPNRLRLADRWGLGWALSDWGGRRVLSHTGDTIGQSASLHVVPDARVAVALLTNGDRTWAFAHEALTTLLRELCDLAVPAPLEPPPEPPRVDLGAHVGVYERLGTRMQVRPRDGGLVLRVTRTGPLADLVPAFAMDLVPVTEALLVGRPAIATRWIPVLFLTLPDGRAYVHDGIRATPRVDARA